MLWYLGINDDKPDDTKGRYEFPYGGFENVHRCGVLAESRAGQYKHIDIESAAAHLHGMIDAQRGESANQTSTDIPRKASVVPTKLPTTGITCRISRATATGID